MNVSPLLGMARGSSAVRDGCSGNCHADVGFAGEVGRPHSTVFGEGCAAAEFLLLPIDIGERRASLRQPGYVVRATLCATRC